MRICLIVRCEFRSTFAFDGSNFNNWKEEHDLLRYVYKSVSGDSSLEVSAETEQERVVQGARLEKAKKMEMKCKSVMVQRIADSHLEYIKDKATPKDIWETLSNTFERKGIASQLFLRKKLITMKYVEGSLESHFLSFDKILRELKSTGAKLEDQVAVCHLLLTLPNSYDSLITALETMSPSQLTMDFVKGRLLDEEIKRNAEKSPTSTQNTDNSTAFTGKPKPAFKFRCYYCGRVFWRFLLFISENLISKR